MPKTKRVKAKKSLILSFQDERGSMPLALVLITFVLIFATIITATLAYQISANARSTGDQTATWALDSAQNLSAESIGTANKTLSGLPTAGTAAWLKSKDGTYEYKWWVNGSAPKQISTNGADFVPTTAAASSNDNQTGNTCAVLDSGAINCWGANASGQLGNGTVLTSTTPVAVSNISTAINVSVGAGTNTMGQHPYITNPNQGFACAVLSDGTIKCWGDNAYGQLGNGTTTSSLTPVTVTGINTAVSVNAGTNYACALLNGGTVQCWGLNTQAELGNGSTTNSSTPVTVTGITGATQLSVGAFHSCVITNTFAINCWGDNTLGEVAGAASTTPATTPTTVTGITATSTTGTASIAAGARTTCVITNTGTINCWGDGLDGQLGNGTNTNTLSTTPATVTGITNPKAITAENFGFCAITNSSTIQCWGDNYFGELGNGGGTTLSDSGPGNPAPAVTSNTPITVPGLTQVTQIAGGPHTACAILNSNATATCWGNNESGQTGNNGTANQTTPTQTNITANATQIVLDSSGYSGCALVGTTIQCWGLNTKGQLGNGTTVNSPTPVTVTGLSATPTAIAMGGNSACALITGGTVQCWGDNTHGQLGNGTTTNSLTPVTVTGLTGVTKIAGGNNTFCAITSTAAECWGNGTLGTLGNGTNTTSQTTPVPVTGLTTGVTTITLGGSTACAITSGAVQCWGEGTSGQLGNGSTTNTTTPVPATGLTSGITSLSTGANSTTICAILTTGTIDCWGSNAQGTITPGTANATLYSTPTPVTGITGVSNISISTNTNTGTACATHTTGGAQCWGTNTYGQLGNGTQLPTGTTSSPVNISGYTSTSVTSIYVGLYETCAIINAKVLCWGWDASGDLGTGANTTTQGQITAATSAPALTSTTATSQIEIKLITNPGAGIPANTPEYKETATYKWNASTNNWIITNINSKQ